MPPRPTCLKDTSPSPHQIDGGALMPDQPAASETQIDDIDYFNRIVRRGQFDGSVDPLMSQTEDFSPRIELAQ